MGVRLRFVGVTALMIAIGATANADTIGIATGAGSNWLNSTELEPISLPEILRPTLGADHEEPASAEEPANVQDPAVHPDEVLKSLQESVQRLSAAGFAEEAAAATRLLQQFEQKYHARLILALQSSHSAKHRSELDRLQRRLAKFDIDAEEEQRLQLESKLPEAEGKLSGYHYQMSEKWFENVSRTRRQAVPEAPRDRIQFRDNGVDNIPRSELRSLNSIEIIDALVRRPDFSYQRTVHLIDDMTATYQLLESSKWTKDRYPVQR